MTDTNYDPVAELEEQIVIRRAVDALDQNGTLAEVMTDDLKQKLNPYFVHCLEHDTELAHKITALYDAHFDPDNKKCILLVLADALEQGLLPFGFNMSVYAISADANADHNFRDMSGRDFKAVADLAGWFAAIFNIFSTVRIRPLEIGELEALSERTNLIDYFEVGAMISQDDAVNLISPENHDMALMIDQERFTSEQAVRVLRTYVATGEVTWAEEWLLTGGKAPLVIGVDHARPGSDMTIVNGRFA